MLARKVQRRRGAALEDAILSTAWDELVSNGYSNFTMDAVAAKAKTSRPVLYRRWPHRVDLAVAALRHQLYKNPLTAPDMGNIRDDLIELLYQTAERGVPLAIIFTLQMGSLYGETGITPARLREDVLSGLQNTLSAVLLRGVARGEVDGSKLTPRIMSLPYDLLRHEVSMTLTSIPMSVIAEMVDEIFLPLILPKPASRGRQGAARPGETVAS